MSTWMGSIALFRFLPALGLTACAHANGGQPTSSPENVPSQEVYEAAAPRTLGNTHLVRKECAQATAAYDQARALYERALGAGDVQVGVVLSSLARARACEGDSDGAIANFERSYGIMAAIPSRLPDRVDIASRLAVLLQMRGETSSAPLR